MEDPSPRRSPLSASSSSPGQGIFDGHPASAGAGSTRDYYLSLLSDTLDDFEHLRIATENRVRQLTRTEPDEDGIIRGLGLDERSPEVAVAVATLDGIKALEHEAELNLKRRIRKHALYPWIKGARGVGEKQAARLIAVVGDPYWNDLHERPRTVSELWAYCGYSVIAGSAQRRKKGVKSNWSAKAKSRAYLIAVSAMKAGGPYRDMYLAERESHEGVLVDGEPITKGHSHNRALRRVAKEVLKDMWIAARDARDT